MQEVESAEFLIMDNSCKIFGVFPQPTCGVPYVLEANYLDYVLTLTTISTTTPSGYFSFQYGNGKYSIDNNHCGCSHSAKSTTVYQSYNCAFPVAGQPTNRSIEFEA